MNQQAAAGDSGDKAPERDGQFQTPPRRLGRLLYVAYLLLILASLEGASRFIVSRSPDMNLRRVVFDHGRLARGELDDTRFVPDSELPYRLRPGFVYTSPDGLQTTVHNDAGFRDTEPFPPKSDDMLRIVCLGGSTTYGVSVHDNAATYPAILERLLAETLPDEWAAAEVFNLGVGGYTSREVLQTLRLYGLPLKPDIVLIQCAVNDVAPRFYPDFREDYTHFRKPLQPLNTNPLARLAFRSHLVVITGWQLGYMRPLTLQARTQHPMPTAAEAVTNLARNGTRAYRDTIAEAVSLAENAGAQVWLLTQAHIFGDPFRAPDEETRLLDEAYRAGLTEHNAVLRSLAASESVGLIDLERDMPRDTVYFSDPVHMTEDGNRVKAELIANALRPAIASLRAR